MNIINKIRVRLSLARQGYTPESFRQEQLEEAFFRCNGCTIQEAADMQVIGMVNEHHSAMLGIKAELPF